MAAAAGAFAPAGGLSLLPRSKARASHTASARKAACMTKISDARTMQVFLSQKPFFMMLLSIVDDVHTRARQSCVENRKG